MIAERKVNEEIFTITLSEKFNIDCSESLILMINRIIESNKVKKIVLDLSKVIRIDSTAIGLLLRMTKYLSGIQGYLIICGVNSHIYKMFSDMEILRLINITKSIDEAMALLKKN